MQGHFYKAPVQKAIDLLKKKKKAQQQLDWPAQNLWVELECLIDALVSGSKFPHLCSNIKQKVFLEKCKWSKQEGFTLID